VLEFNVTVLKTTAGFQALEVELNGTLDTDTVNSFKEVLDKLLEKGARHAVLNCSKLKYVTSSGLLALNKHVKSFEDRGGRLVFSNVLKPFSYVLKVSSFDTVFDIFADTNEALRALEAGAA
jgi:anti-anti-sigma factor